MRSYRVEHGTINIHTRETSQRNLNGSRLNFQKKKTQRPTVVSNGAFEDVCEIPACSKDLVDHVLICMLQMLATRPC